ncbi:hypothetical protein [Vibrio jasicida]|nr:hypothetical protein [Vibrio jasicida]
MSSLQSLKEKALADPEVKAQYDALESEFIDILSSMHELAACVGKLQSKH